MLIFMRAYEITSSDKLCHVTTWRLCSHNLQYSQRSTSLTSALPKNKNLSWHNNALLKCVVLQWTQCAFQNFEYTPHASSNEPKKTSCYHSDSLVNSTHSRVHLRLLRSLGEIESVRLLILRCSWSSFFRLFIDRQSHWHPDSFFGWSCRHAHSFFGGFVRCCV